MTRYTPQNHLFWKHNELSTFVVKNNEQSPEILGVIFFRCPCIICKSHDSMELLILTRKIFWRSAHNYELLNRIVTLGAGKIRKPEIIVDGSLTVFRF